MSIAGYTYGTEQVPRARLSLEELALLERTLLFGEEDVAALRESKAILAPQVEAILDVWYGFVGSQPHLLESFSDPRDGKPLAAYLEAVRKRFGQWILDTASAEYGQAWLDYQEEIGRRHHRSGKNRTDGVEAAEHVPFRYLPALIYPIVHTLKPFLEKSGASPERVEKMHQAWLKSVLLQVILWSRPYVREGDY
jgi:hypothetical protein